MGRTIAILAFLMLVPVAVAQTEPGIYNPYQSTPTTMYFHINGFQDFPINTQKPSDLFAEEVRVGNLPSSCVQSPLGSATYQSKHTWYGYSSPSIVQYDVVENGKPRIHQERGLSYDIDLDGSVEPVFRWYLAHASPARETGSVDPDQAPPPVPGVIVRAIIREGDDMSVGHAALNTGEVIAQGQTEPTLLAGPATPDSDQVRVIEKDGRYLYEFTIPLKYEQTTIDKDESFNIRVDAFMDEPLCQGPNPGESGDYLMPDVLLVYTDPDHRPRLDWAIMNPLYIETIHPMFVGDDIIIHTESNSPWGSYDVMGDVPQEPTMQLQIDGPTEARSLELIKHVEHSTGHYSHNMPVMVVWQWDYLADNAAPGIYTFRFEIENDQQTADALAIATFQVGSGGDGEVCRTSMDDNEVVCESVTQVSSDEKAPGPAMPLLLAALAAIGIARRRS